MAEPNRPGTVSWPIVAGSIFITLVMAYYVLNRYTGFDLTAPFSSSPPQLDGGAEESLQPAVSACRAAMNSQLGSSLISATLDPRSTRYLAGSREYVVFLDVRLRGQDRVEYYYECNVSAVSQQVTRTRLNGPPGSFEGISIN